LPKDSLQQFRTFVKNREASFLMSPVKVTARTDIPEANLSTFTLKEVAEGDVVEVPRWVAEVLEENNLVNLGEEGVEAELFRALQREKLQGPTQPSQLSKDIYLKLRRYLMILRRKNPQDPHYQKIKVSTQDLITTRLVKMVTMAGYTSQPEPTILLSPEELLLYREIRELVSEWRSLVLGEEKP
jgi:DNA replication factor GINS